MRAAMVTAGRAPDEGAVGLLVAAAREGDRGAFGALYQRYARMVHGILLGRVPVADVEDLVQDVFVRAMRQVHTLRDVNCFGGWLATVARNRANDFHRRSVELVEFTEETRIAGGVPGGADFAVGGGDDGAGSCGADGTYGRVSAREFASRDADAAREAGNKV